jgi:hypothetical protein
VTLQVEASGKGGVASQDRLSIMQRIERSAGILLENAGLNENRPWLLTQTKLAALFLLPLLAAAVFSVVTLAFLTLFSPPLLFTLPALDLDPPIMSSTPRYDPASSPETALRSVGGDWERSLDRRPPELEEDAELESC